MRPGLPSWTHSVSGYSIDSSSYGCSTEDGHPELSGKVLVILTLVNLKSPMWGLQMQKLPHPWALLLVQRGAGTPSYPKGCDF